VIYEVHVKGFSKLWRELPEQLRGTYAGSVARLRSTISKAWCDCGGTTPVHAHIDDKFLVENGLTNYWGYNTIGFFAPHAEYSSSGQMGQQVAEFKAMVRSLHAAGIEVILDVVYNHTGEGNHLAQRSVSAGSIISPTTGCTLRIPGSISISAALVTA
jgi:Type II secretory pathway, pullulanase PulA and related glycosidases